MTKDCCKSGKKDRKCHRKGDGKVFKLPRKFSKKSCMEEVKGFTKRSSCAPYKNCKKGRSTRRRSKKRRSKKRRSKRRKSKRRKSKKRMSKKRMSKKLMSKKGYSSYTRKDSSCTNDSIIFSPSTTYKLKWRNLGVNNAWNGNERLNIYHQYTRDQIYYNTNLRDKYVNYYSVMPSSLTITIKDNNHLVKSYLFEDTEVLYEGRGNKINLYQHKKSGHNIILKLQSDPSIDSDGTCGLIRSKKLAELSFVTGEPMVRTLYINLMQSFTSDLDKMSELYLSNEPTENDIDINQVYQRVKDMLICLSNEKKLYYTDLKTANIFVCLDKLKEKNIFSFYLGDIDSAIRLNTVGVSTYPPPEYASDPGNIIINTPEEGKRYLTWQLGATILELCSKKLAQKIYWTNIEYVSVDDIYKIVEDIIKFLKETHKEIKNSHTKETRGDKFREKLIFILERTLSRERKPIDKLPDSNEFDDIILAEIFGNIRFGNSTKKRKSPKKKTFLYNPNDPKKSFDVYIDKNPKDTIPIKYRTYTDTKNTIRKLESLYKKGKYPHKRIFQVAMILRVRLKVLKKDKKRSYDLACRYYDFIKSRTKVKGEKARKKLAFKY